MENKKHKRLIRIGGDIHFALKAIALHQKKTLTEFIEDELREVLKQPRFEQIIQIYNNKIGPQHVDLLTVTDNL